MSETGKRPSSKEWTVRIQIYGLLQKKSVGQQSGKWTKRFFLIRDGFLVYYAEQEKKDFEKREYFNAHPKGIVPLGECQLLLTQDPVHPFCIQINSSDMEEALVLATETEFERSRWLDIMEKSRRVTWQNTNLSDEMIRQLENDGLVMAREKQDYFDRLQTEAHALSEQRIRAEELEKINSELEYEKKKLESFTAEIQDEYEQLRIELEDTILAMRDIEDEKRDLNGILEQQSCNLSKLEEDREKVLKELQDRQETTSQLSQEKQYLSETTEELRRQLEDIEKQTESIRTETDQAKEKLNDNVKRLLELEEEKSTISEHAQELQSTIQDLKAQKEMTEKELREEIKARISAEERLRNAEMSLKQLDSAVQSQTPNIEKEVREEMSVSVNKLKNFFEVLATESKISSDKPLIMRNAVTARKTLVKRTKTFKYENRKQTCKSWTSPEDNRPHIQVRRAVTSVGPSTISSYNTPLSPTDGPVFEDSF